MHTSGERLACFALLELSWLVANLELAQLTNSLSHVGLCCVVRTLRAPPPCPPRVPAFTYVMSGPFFVSSYVEHLREGKTILREVWMPC